MTVHIPLAHRSGTIHKEPPWKWPFIYGFIAFCILAAITIGGYQTDRNNKIASYLQYARDTKAYFCGANPEAITEFHTKALATQQLWESHLAEKNFTGLVITRGMDFSFEEALLRMRCDGAKALVSQAQSATTEDEKLASYSATAEYYAAAQNEVDTYLSRLLENSNAATDVFAYAVSMEQTHAWNETSITNMVLARESFKSMQLDAVVMYSQRAIDAFSLLPVNTPMPTQSP